MRYPSASGALHNIGNAMTPLGVHIAALRDCLHKAPAADVELAESVTSAGAEIDTIARQAQTVQSVLAEQRAFRQAGPLVEEIPRA
jgi:hypothetical protein